MVDSKNSHIFKISKNKFLIFNAGFNDLGDIELIITLTDNNKMPKSSNYRLIVTVLPSDLIDMENTNVQKNNETNFESTLIGTNNTDKFKVSPVSPTGEVQFTF